MPAKSDLDLIRAEEGLHLLFSDAMEKGTDPSPLLAAHEVVAKAMRSKGIPFDPLGKKDPHTSHGYDPDDDDDDDTTNDENDSDSDGGMPQGSDDAKGSELREPTERQKPRKRSDIKDTDGPYVMKGYNPDEARGEGGKWTSGGGSSGKRGPGDEREAHPHHGRGMTRQEGLDNGQLVDTGHGTYVRSNHPGNGWGPEPLERLRQDAMDTSSSDMEGSEPSHGYNPDSQPRAGDAVRAQNAAHGGPRPLHKIASEIRRDWSSQKGGVNYAAKPYLDALSGLDQISDNYGADSAKTVVSYLLNNMGQWRGETARKVKAELKGMLKTSYSKALSASCENCGMKAAPGKSMCYKCYGSMKKDSGPPPSFTHPEDDPVISRKGTKSGKGGEKNRLKPKKVSSVDNDTDDENDGTLGYITAVNKGEATPHDFDPVRNICKNCRTGSEAHGEGLDHDFNPVRNICKTCRQGSEMHKMVGQDAILKSVAMVDDPDFWEFFKALPQLSTGDRSTMAEQGIALPDGSFPIPDEAHLHAAIRLVGQAQDPQSAMNHIIERAHAMGMQPALPPAWNVSGNPNQGVAAIGEGAHSLQNSDPQNMQATNASPIDPAAAGEEGMGEEMGEDDANPAGMAGVGAAPTAPGAAAADRSSMTSQDGMQDTSMEVSLAPTKKQPKKKGATPLSGSGPTQPGLMKRLAGMFTSGEARSIDLDDDFEYAVVKSAAESRYTLGPVYMPGQLDAHGEWATAEDLQKATWDFVKDSGSDHSVYLQHSDQPAGEWVEIMAWPHPVTATMNKAAGSASVDFPAGTVYMGVTWEPWAWNMVKAGKITGFSMGGWAQRVEGVPG